MSLRSLRAPRAGTRTAVRLPRRPCPQPGCSVLTDGGRCPAHARAYEDQRPNADVRRWYHTPRWFALRAVVLREEPWCAECLVEGYRVRTTDADHTVPHRGDPELFWSRANLRAMCHAHHSRKTARGE